MNLLHKNMNNDNNTENPTKRAYIVSSTSLPPSLQISNSMHPQKNKPFYSQESSEQPLLKLSWKKREERNTKHNHL
ncbi:hypothetical protein JHK84_044453 [Glycine max]|nr:hypothetical protein JHK86_044340 [Glycine max]KAG4940300.1 hypothetical protein JHK87_044171 [Glycine soja]KAG5107546.1 hypothetical protein JHK84_044453 [Glycine max]KHN46771.1 hypothetical protein glysoja_015022 [Glycine soja]